MAACRRVCCLGARGARRGPARAIALRRGALRGLRGHAGAIAAYTACEIAVPFVLIAVGERYISSSLAAILVATMPLQLALLALWLSPAHRPTGLRVVGLAIGLGGVVALLGVDVGGGPNELLGAVLVLVATLDTPLPR